MLGCYFCRLFSPPFFYFIFFSVGRRAVVTTAARLDFLAVGSTVECNKKCVLIRFRRTMVAWPNKGYDCHSTVKNWRPLSSLAWILSFIFCTCQDWTSKSKFILSISLQLMTLFDIKIGLMHFYMLPQLYSHRHTHTYFSALKGLSLGSNTCSDVNIRLKKNVEFPPRQVRINNEGESLARGPKLLSIKIMLLR